MRQNKNKFGLFIRELRIKKNIGQRDLAKKIGVSPSYLNDIEKEKRSAPKLTVIKKISKYLETNLDELNDLAGVSKKRMFFIDHGVVIPTYSEVKIS